MMWFDICLFASVMSVALYYRYFTPTEQDILKDTVKHVYKIEMFPEISNTSTEDIKHKIVTKCCNRVIDITELYRSEYCRGVWNKRKHYFYADLAPHVADSLFSVDMYSDGEIDGIDRCRDKIDEFTEKAQNICTKFIPHYPGTMIISMSNGHISL